ncbi:TPA: phage major capsid protein, P2 family [Vibrio parahaemolyticus]|uniref:phage major capsid protein, P2 family n=1 Tax=Vibrio parahaemolyticus TaxID=670 RepID=UPI0007615CBD|nr:phage major capsid protein, P2 family [Vibrio parahaemolyticus]KWU34637.1 major capsid protein [Vibrio parahaemolyticus]MQF76795.1 phage major capsid protein, P2 family [Vibrio parahaemolyticus]HCE4768781.1 phage major capsid protein, P2 family [Vibrio parahaemolyticus]HCG5712508.1 phage major capsid protein, P2 family [Vibrio parahaemolyticus]HCG8715083.1 phage major capsid protein, P2 family [Vibrio parahaemolyticus]
MLNPVSTQLLQEFTQGVATTAGAPTAYGTFNITPPMETALRQAILQSHSFLGMISLIPKLQIQGQVVDVGNDGLATGRAATGRYGRKMGQTGNTYQLVKTDSGAFIEWDTLTEWANSGDKGQWMKLMKNAITSIFALDMLRIGFNGVKVETPTDPVTYPMGEDVNKGWKQLVKEKMPSQVLANAKLDPTGSTADSYKNLDSLVQSMINDVIAPEHREDPDLVVVVGSALVASEQHRLLEAANTPTEHAAAQKLAKTIAGKHAYIPPFFSANGIWVTNLKNLQILTQTGTQQRRQKNDDDELMFKSNHLRMEGYAVGNMKKFAAIEQVDIITPAH